VSDQHGHRKEEAAGGEQLASAPEVPTTEQYSPRRFLRYQTRFGGFLGPLLTTIVAFLMGGLVVALAGKNPLRVYEAIWNGTGLGWFFDVGSHDVGIPGTETKVWFPWDTASVTALNLQQTLLITTSIILTGLAVAFAFRCGMFNIGGQGQYFAGSFVAVWVGSSFADLNGFLHIVFALVAGALTGAVYAGIAGLLKATVGAHEVISTIMLNWIAIWVGSYLFGQGGPLQNDLQPSIPISNDIVEAAKLPVFWGDPLLQGLSVGIFVAVAFLVVYWVVINRTTLGYEVRAVGFNPEAARYGGISVARNYFLAMAISGLFAGLAGALDVLGWQFRIAETDIRANTLGFIGLAAALLGRNTALGVGAASLLFGALITGTSGRQLDPEIFRPDLAGNLTTIIQGLVVLFVGLNILALARRRR